MSLEVIIGNNQEATEIPENWPTALESIAHEAASLALENAAEDDSPLSHLATLEVAIVDDATSDQVHRDFMDIEGPTDVITFRPGEIVIGAEVAERQAAEYDEPGLPAKSSATWSTVSSTWPVTKTQSPEQARCHGSRTGNHRRPTFGLPSSASASIADFPK